MAERSDQAPSHEDRIRTNYNATGVAIMQTMYSDDYLSIGGVVSTDQLASLAGLTSSSVVLDIGCGVGGPALHLAETVGCRVHGIDLVESNIAEAQQRAEQRDLAGLVTFTAADATQLPTDDGGFNVVFGQDAWCHVPDKRALLQQAARTLRPGGTIAFTDWLAGSGMSGAERAAALDAAASRDAATAAQYEAMLSEAGFVDIAYVDISEIFAAQYHQVYARLQAAKAELIETFSERVFAIVSDMNRTILHGFEDGAIGGGQFVARLR